MIQSGCPVFLQNCDSHVKSRSVFHLCKLIILLPVKMYISLLFFFSYQFFFYLLFWKYIKSYRHGENKSINATYPNIVYYALLRIVKLCCLSFFLSLPFLLCVSLKEIHESIFVFTRIIVFCLVFGDWCCFYLIERRKGRR